MKIAVAMSGGVDSSVAALLLKEQGHDIVGVSMINRPRSRLGGPDSLADARRVAAHLDIPHRSYDLISRFAEAVVDPFCEAYLSGRTPNPCPRCNAELKFGELCGAAQRDLGIEALATGHYARTSFDGRSGRWQLRRGVDPAREQSYVLYGLSQEQLDHAIFPLGELHKSQVEALAREAGLPLSPNAESQDACFIDKDLRSFLQARLGEQIQPGNIVDGSARVLGRHPGVAFYTLGQRKGLLSGQARPLYVVELRPNAREIVVGPLEETFASELRCRDFEWLSVEPRDDLVGQVQVRYRCRPADARVLRRGPGCEVRFDQPQPSVTAGQAAVVYQDDLLLGGGVIAWAGG